MSRKEEYDVENICRVCLLNDNDLQLIFETQTKPPSIAEMLSELTIYKVQRFDNLPHLICAMCLKAVLVAYKIKQTCEQSYRKLIQLMDMDEVAVLDRGEKYTQTDDISLYPCERCEEKFFTYDTLRTHRKNIHKGSAIKCRFCSRSFDRIGYLRTHIAVFHPESGYRSHNQCRICKRQFTRREHMHRHMSQVHKIASIKDIKEKLNEDLQLLLKPGAKVSDVKTMETESMENVLRNHGETVENVAKLANNDDDEQLLDNMLIDDDMSTPNLEDVLIENMIEVKAPSVQDKTTTDAYKVANVVEECLPTAKRKKGRPPKSATPCEYCDKFYDNISKLQNHIVEEHQRAENYLCKLCDEKFFNEKDLRTHLRTNHNSELLNATTQENCGKKYNTHCLHSCPKCLKSFSTENALQKHLENKHEKVKMKCYACKECYQEFSSREELKCHAKDKGHDKLLLCPECGLRCKSKNSLLVHMRRHNGEKPYKCKFCSKGFPRMDDLRLHEKYHTGEKSHFCETCGKGFQRKYSLTIHLRVHTGEKPYKCPHCPQSFAQGNDLKAHIRRHTGERFRCDICNAAFLQGYQIRQHKLKEHGIYELPPTQRVKKFTSLAEQEKQIQENMQKE